MENGKILSATTRLCTHRRDAEKYNSEKLKSLKGKFSVPIILSRSVYNLILVSNVSKRSLVKCEDIDYFTLFFLYLSFMIVSNFLP